MRKVLIIIGLLFGFGTTQAQNSTKTSKPEADCYLKWFKKFKERGAYDVADGIYTDVIIVIRETATANCYDGKAEVYKGLVTKFSILLEDGTYANIPHELKQESKGVAIEGGMSKAMLTTDNKHIYVLWPKVIKPKPAPFKKAAEPTDD